MPLSLCECAELDALIDGGPASAFNRQEIVHLLMIQLQRLPILLLMGLPLASCISSDGGQSGARTDGTEQAASIEPAELVVATIEPQVDPCEEIRRQLAESRRAFGLLGASSVRENRARSESALRKAEGAADASRAVAAEAAGKHLAAQKEMRRVDATRSDEADAFCREVLELSGIGESGSLTKRETGLDSQWVAFTVLEDPATDVYYLEGDEDPNSGERSRIALQETIFTEFPKYWDRTRETRDRLNLAALELASTLRVKRESDEAAKQVRERITARRERWYASCEASQRAETALQEMLELEQSLERCAGGEGLSDRIQRLELRLASLDLRASELHIEFDRTREEIFVIAPSGYRHGSERHLAAAWAVLQEMLISLEAGRGSTERALSAFARERRDKTREHATRAQRACDQVEEGFGDMSKFFDRARFAAEEGEASYFQDDPETRARNAALSRMDLDGVLLEGLHDAVSAENLDAAWAEQELWTNFPVWLSSFEQEGVLRMPETAVDAARGLLTYLKATFRPCEPKVLHAGVVRGLLDSGHARTEQDAYLMLGELCSLMHRLSAMTNEY